MSTKDIDVRLPDVGPSGLRLDEVVPGGGAGWYSLRDDH